MLWLTIPLSTPPMETWLKMFTQSGGHFAAVKTGCDH